MFKGARFRSAFAVLVMLAAIFAVTRPASAATGKVTLKTKEVNEVSGGWHVFVTIELPKAPLTAHQSMKFFFTKTAVYERSLVDGKSEPVNNRMAMTGQAPTIEGLDVDFADPSGKIFSKTRFDFSLGRPRGYEAGEYKMEVRSSDGFTIGATQDLILKGDNPPVDRRTMAFNAKDKSIKKVDAYDAGDNQAKNDQPVAAANNGPGEVTPTGTATGFVPPEGQQETEEEKIKTKPGGCGCEVPGRGGSWSGVGTGLFFLLPIFGISAVAFRRRLRRNRGA
jgi:hypothetical protein